MPLIDGDMFCPLRINRGQVATVSRYSSAGRYDIPDISGQYLAPFFLNDGRLCLGSSFYRGLYGGFNKSAAFVGNTQDGGCGLHSVGGRVSGVKVFGNVLNTYPIVSPTPPYYGNYSRAGREAENDSSGCLVYDSINGIWLPFGPGIEYNGCDDVVVDSFDNIYYQKISYVRMIERERLINSLYAAGPTNPIYQIGIADDVICVVSGASSATTTLHYYASGSWTDTTQSAFASSRMAMAHNRAYFSSTIPNTGTSADVWYFDGTGVTNTNLRSLDVSAYGWANVVGVSVAPFEAGGNIYCVAQVQEDVNPSASVIFVYDGSSWSLYSTSYIPSSGYSQLGKTGRGVIYDSQLLIMLPNHTDADSRRIGYDNGTYWDTWDATAPTQVYDMVVVDGDLWVCGIFFGQVAVYNGVGWELRHVGYATGSAKKLLVGWPSAGS